MDDHGIELEVIRRAAELNISNTYRIASGPTAVIGEHAMFPAIAIPIESAKDFECREEDLDRLKDLLKEVTQVLVIGWRGTERHFTDLMREAFADRRMRSTFVCGYEALGDQTERDRQLAGLAFDQGQSYDGGFTKFIRSRISGITSFDGWPNRSAPRISPLLRASASLAPPHYFCTAQSVQAAVAVGVAVEVAVVGPKSRPDSNASAAKSYSKTWLRRSDSNRQPCG